MLLNEVEPFADAHIVALQTMISKMESCIANPEELNKEDIPEWRNKLVDCVHGFMQFKASMTHELNQKEKFRQAIRDL